MKTATIPSLRVAPLLRAAAESVLEAGETLSGFVEHSLQLQIERRKSQREFIARGKSDYFAAGDVLRELDELLLEVQLRQDK